MSNIFNVGGFSTSNFFADEALLIPHHFTTEGVNTVLMMLTEELISEVKSLKSYDDMISSAANNGMAYYKTVDCMDSGTAHRVADNEKLVKSINKLWQKEEMDKGDPSIMQLIGMEVCEISGLTDYVNAQLKEEVELKQLEEDERAEEAKNHLAEGSEFNIGGELVSGDTELGNLDPSQLAADALNNAA